MTPACTIADEENPNAKPVPYLHSHPFPMSREQYERFLITLDFAMPRWHAQFDLEYVKGCVESKSTFIRSHEIQGAIKTFLVMDQATQDVSLPCHGEVR